MVTLLLEPPSPLERSESVQSTASSELLPLFGFVTASASGSLLVRDPEPPHPSGSTRANVKRRIIESGNGRFIEGMLELLKAAELVYTTFSMEGLQHGTCRTQLPEVPSVG